MMRSSVVWIIVNWALLIGLFMPRWALKNTYFISPPNHLINKMSSRLSASLTRRASPANISKLSSTNATPWRGLATPAAHPVTQNATGSKGPTAMVFMNMGGPSTVDEVGGFLSNLFVCAPLSIDSWDAEMHSNIPTEDAPKNQTRHKC